MLKRSTWFSLAQAIVLLVGIAFTCNIGLALLPASEQLSETERYIRSTQANGEQTSSQEQKVLQLAQETYYPLLWQFLGAMGLTAALWFTLHSLKTNGAWLRNGSANKTNSSPNEQVSADHSK